MFKAVEKPKEYIAIKVPDDCEDVGKLVSEEAEKSGIRLDVYTYYAEGKAWDTKVGVKINETQTAKRGSIIVCKIGQDGSKYPEAVDVMSQKEFDKSFKAVDATTLNACDLPYKIGTSISEPKQPHVRIDIDNIHDTPRIYVDGELLHGITAVVFHFMIRDDVDLGQQSIEIEHYVKDSSLIGMHRETIGERRV